MYSNRNDIVGNNSNAPELKIVVKLKTSSPNRRLLKAAATDAVEPEESGYLNKWLNSKRLRSMQPVFGKAPSRGVSNFRRMAMAAVDESDKKLSGLNVLTLRSSDDAKKALKEILKDPLVEHAYIPPMRYVLNKTSTSVQDPLINRQWGLSAIKLFQAEQAAGFKPAANVKIAIIDSGIDAKHPDLKGILIEELNFTTGPKRDTSGHGTHVAGIIGSVTNNSIGVRGITQSKQILSLKALDPYSPEGYYQAIKHAIDANVRVINLSLGGSQDPTEEELIKTALKKGIVVVAAMGNEKLEGNATSYPAAISGVIAVGASDELDKIADFSNTGTHIDLVAPGVNVLSTVPTYSTSKAEGKNYEAWPGTSMATPMVAATAALLVAKKPAATRANIRKALVQGAEKVPGQTKFSTTFGHGRLNVIESLKRI
jgi:hypothetical protein